MILKNFALKYLSSSSGRVIKPFKYNKKMLHSHLTKNKLFNYKNNLNLNIYRKFCNESKDNSEPIFKKDGYVITGFRPGEENEVSNINDENMTGEDGKVEIGNINHYRFLTLVFTCRVCKTRAARQFSHHAYTKGIVILQCPGCDNNHLIADNLGWFDKGRNIEEIMQKKGETIQTIKSRDEIPESDLGYVEEAEKLRQRAEDRKIMKIKKELYGDNDESKSS